MADVYVCPTHGKSECEECAAIYAPSKALTVEGALRELREMFGDGPYIRVTWRESITNWSRNGPERSASIQIGNWYSSAEPTLDEAMALTRRTWEGHRMVKQSQDNKESK